jgi:hypothetical protein
MRTKHFTDSVRNGVLVQVFFIFLLMSVNSCSSEHEKETSFDRIERTFTNIPDSIQTSVYWYWISDNISEEGVKKDLQAMKKVGINRVFIGNIGLNDIPAGKVKIFSDEWWQVVHTALKTATELNIEVGMFNSPGWSQSGGPWVKNEQSMRYLNSAETYVTGPTEFKGKLNVPEGDFQPVNVIAYKVPDSAENDFRSMSQAISSVPRMPNLSYLIDKNISTEVPLQSGMTLSVDFTTSGEAALRTLIIKTSGKKTKAKGEFFVKEGENFRLLKSFEIDRSNSSVNVGFDPFAPVVIAIPDTRAKTFRLVISDVSVAGGIVEVELSSVPKVERYPEKSLAKMFQTPLPYWHDYLWPVQPEPEDKSFVIDPKGVLDITDKLSTDGTLTWQVPEGNWVIMQNGMTTTGQTNSPAPQEGTGLETDKMSKKHIAAHFEAFLGEILRRVPAEDRKTFRVAVQDSYETGSQNWTDGLIEEYTGRYGYSPVPFIPVLKGSVVGSRDMSDRFLWDLRRIVADKVAYDYVGGLREVCHRNGLTTWLENYGHWGFPGEFLQYGGQSDEVGGEFWSEGDLGNIENRAASSSAHIYGKTKVSAESFTCAGNAFSRYPATMKQRGDRFFTEGINNTLLHVYIHQPDEREPGLNAWFGNEFNRHNTWFSYMDLFTNYLKRTNYMLQQGKYVADAAYFIGEDAPKMTGVCDPVLPKGYSFDYINGEVIMNRLSVKDGRLTLSDGMSYRILVLPKLAAMRPELLRKIRELVMQGAVVLGRAPEFSPSLQNYPDADLQLRQLASELWGDVDGITVKSRKAGKGMILSGMELQEALDLINVVPDCRFAENDPALFIHRYMAEGDIYFISNQSDTAISIYPEFRVAGRSPESWDPVAGTLRILPAYSQKDVTTVVPLKLEANESQFIIFRKKAGRAVSEEMSVNFPESRTIAELNGPWSVTFDHEKRGPSKPVDFKDLTDWTHHDNDSIRYFSGTAVYRISVNLPEIQQGREVFLDLGRLTAMAKVKVNGNYAGGAWTAPMKLNISSFIKSGNNEIEISVVNNWMNRLIGDLKLPEEKRAAWSLVVPYTKDFPLQPSGLFGPVKISEIKFNN